MDLSILPRLEGFLFFSTFAKKCQGIVTQGQKTKLTAFCSLTILDLFIERLSVNFICIDECNHAFLLKESSGGREGDECALTSPAKEWKKGLSWSNSRLLYNSCSQITPRVPCKSTSLKCVELVLISSTNARAP